MLYIVWIIPYQVYDLQIFSSVLYTVFTFFFFSFLMATPAAFGNSQARGQIKAAAAGYVIAIAKPEPSHGNTRAKPHL